MSQVRPFALELAGRRAPNVSKGSIAVPVDQRIHDALKLNDLKWKLPKNPRVVDIRVDDYVNTDGEDALRVWVIIDETVNPEKFKGEDISALKRAIHDRVRELGVGLWPYIRIAKQSEIDERDEE
jgi:uncharacterized Ntn-hydrolase superfamily protein